MRLTRVRGVPLTGEPLSLSVTLPDASGRLGGQAHLVVSTHPGKLGHGECNEQADAKNQCADEQSDESRQAQDKEFQFVTTGEHPGSFYSFDRRQFVFHDQ